MFVVKNNRNKKIIDEHPVYANELEDKSEKYMFYMWCNLTYGSIVLNNKH